MSRKLLWPIIIIFSTVLANIVAWNDGGGLLKQAILFWFILVCPGLAIVGLLRLEGSLTEIILAVALSIVLGILASEYTVIIKDWSPTTILLILMVISLFGAILQIIAALKGARPTRAKV